MSKTAQKHGRQKTATVNFSPTWLPRYIDAFGNPGLATLAFWQGALMAEDIRAAQESFPFFELTGGVATGKSIVTNFLWKLLGRDNYEGISFGHATRLGRNRLINSTQGPLVAINSDVDTPFDFDELKELYHGRNPYTYALTGSKGITNYKFRGALMIQNNKRIIASPTLKARMVTVVMDSSQFDHTTLTAAKWCERQAASNIGGFILRGHVKKEQILSAYFTNFPILEKELNYSYKKAISGVTVDSRNIKNHAQIAACAYSLKVLLPDLRKSILEDFVGYMSRRLVIHNEY